ncbi:LysR family transcriptional regulator [Halioglobus japonicus]|uniref:LysR family transcriptional regulator n=1 Tax=Halioglobus japonicus TaxID=930805 RepID=A0AAP8MD94_9GAMM|nr:LysR family transcriptional regulator [Halioglobus japonicus]AQA17741.1 LysR family transcriptional regulator [Halioglobus japonicus]PLW85691.1 LysR family transcriptional regulator [Halioglobus japonicus]GHD16984.1 transcriptional regulator [Halioglobus japonicus]
MSKTTLEQWRMLKAVVEHGGFAHAAEAVHKSQSSINHAVHKLQDQLGIALLEVTGRKAHLTEAGALLLRRAERLLEQSEQLEDIATGLAAGTEAELRLAIDEVFPQCFLADALQAFSNQFPNTRIQLFETVLSGGAEKLVAGEVDILIAGSAPQGFMGNPLLRAEFIAVASAEHPLHRLQRELSLDDLRQHRQIVIRDSALHDSRDSGWLGAEQRWTVSHVATSADMVSRGMGYAWLPSTRVAEGLESGILRELPLGKASRRYAELNLIHADQETAGPAARALEKLLAQTCAGMR